MEFGLTTTGISVKRMADILESLAARLKADARFGANIRVDPESTLGQIVQIFSADLAEVWELAEDVAGAYSLLRANGLPLDDLVQLAAISRRAASATAVTWTLHGTPGTVVPAGSVARLVSGLARFVLDANATIGAGGTVDAAAHAESTGPIPCLATPWVPSAPAASWEIRTPITGWTGVSNMLDATIGRTQESDADLRLRTRAAIVHGPGASADSIRGAILRLDDTVECIVIENRSAFADPDGRPPHSYEVVVRGGDDAEIAQAIWDGGPAGIEVVCTTGAPVTESVTDAAGDAHTVVFSRAADLPVYIEIDYSPRPGFPRDGLAIALDAILEFGSGVLTGQAVTATDIRQAILGAFSGHVLATCTIRMGIAASPPDEGNIPPLRTQRVILDSSRILFFRV